MRSRFSQPEDYQPASISWEERVEEHFTNKIVNPDDLYEAEQDEDRRVDPDSYED